MIVAYWMFGSFLMAVKRLAELREIGDRQRAAAYRRSFGWYTMERLLVSIGYMMRCAPTRELANEFWTKIPPPARLMYSLFGKRKFEREWKTLYRTQT